MDEPTSIVKALKDLDRFLKSGTPATRRNVDYQSYMTSQDSFSSNPKLKLSFGETMMEENGDMNEVGDLYVKKQRESIAGFDIAKKIREKDAEVIDANCAVSALEAKITNVEALGEKAKLDYENELHGLRKKQMRDMELISDLQHQVKQARLKEQEAKDAAVYSKKVEEDNCSNIEMKMNNMRSRGMEQIDKLRNEISSLRGTCIEAQTDLEDKENMVSLLQDENTKLNEQVKISQERFIKRERDLQEFEQTKLQLSKGAIKIKELECKIEELMSQSNHKETIENLFQRVPHLEKELVKVKDENMGFKITSVNVELLEEKLRAANSSIKILENRHSEFTEEIGTLKAQRKHAEEVESAIKAEFEVAYMPTVGELIQRLKDLRKGDKELSKSIDQLRLSVKSHEKTKHVQDTIVKKLRSNHEVAVEKGNKNYLMITRLQRKLVLMSKERDNLRQLVESYKTETRFAPSEPDKQMQESLETELQGYKTEVKKLEQELQASGKRDETEKMDVDDGIAKVTLEKRVLELEEKLKNLTEEKEQVSLKLDRYINKGAYDPATTKVLTLLDNPFDKAVAAKEADTKKLLDENEALKKRIKLMEEGEHMNLTQMVGSKMKESADTNAKQLQEKNDLVELQNKRIIAAFKKKSHELREVVYRLTGYRIDMKNDCRYKIINMYAESTDDYLLFEQTNTGTIELLETDFSATLEDLIEKYLTQENSFPAFLSGLTLDLFGRQTMMISDTRTVGGEGTDADNESEVDDKQDDDDDVASESAPESEEIELEDREEGSVHSGEGEDGHNEGEDGHNEGEDGHDEGEEYGEEDQEGEEGSVHSGHSSEAGGDNDEIGSGTEYMEGEVGEREEGEEDSASEGGSAQSAASAQGSSEEEVEEGGYHSGAENQEERRADAEEEFDEEEGEDDNVDEKEAEDEELEDGEYEGGDGEEGGEGEEEYAGEEEMLEEEEGQDSQDEEEGRPYKRAMTEEGRPYKRARTEEEHQESEASDDDLICLD